MMDFASVRFARSADAGITYSYCESDEKLARYSPHFVSRALL